MPYKRKKKWRKPILAILTRAEDRQAAVLLGCKYTIGGGPSILIQGCVSQTSGRWCTGVCEANRVS